MFFKIIKFKTCNRKHFPFQNKLVNILRGSNSLFKLFMEPFIKKLNLFSSYK